MTEIWVPVPGYCGDYEVSDHGRVRSFKGRETRVLRPAATPDGYPQVALFDGSGRGASLTIHSLVMRAFVGARPDGGEVRHLDGDPTNNRVTNLRYGTSSENRRDSVRHGTHPNAKKVKCKRGHPYNARNTYIRPNGARTCRRCNAESAAKVARRRATERVDA